MRASKRERVCVWERERERSFEQGILHSSRGLTRAMCWGGFGGVQLFDDFGEATLQNPLDPACIRQPQQVSNYFTEKWSCSKAGSYFRPIDFCVTQLQA